MLTRKDAVSCERVGVRRKMGDWSSLEAKAMQRKLARQHKVFDRSESSGFSPM